MALNKLRFYFSNRSKREKGLLVAVASVSTIVLVYYFAFSPIYNSWHELKGQLNRKTSLLKKYLAILSHEEAYIKKKGSLERDFAAFQGKLLTNKTQELAAAELQQIIKKIAVENNLNITRINTQPSETVNEDPSILSIRVNFEIGNVQKLEDLRNFLYSLEYGKDNILFIEDLRIRGLGYDVVRGVSVSTTLSALAMFPQASGSAPLPSKSTITSSRRLGVR